MSNDKTSGNVPTFAKVNKPRLAACFPRQRLFNLLETLRQRPVVWISGPAGSGKTSLVSSYAEVHGLNVLWYQIDARDSDLATFFYHLSLTGKTVIPDLDEPLPALTAEYLPGLTTFTRNYFEAFYSKLIRPFILVLDNYQELVADAQFNLMLNDALAVLPEGGNVFILSRTEPPSDLARLQANQSIGLLNWTDLQLTLDETAGIARLNTQVKFKESDYALLQEKSQGWVAGLVLLLNQPYINDAHLEVASTDFSQAVFDYFSGEIFSKSTQSDKHFLLQSAFLPQMTVQHACLLTGQPKAKDILDELSLRNFFITKHRNPELAYQYHPLFKEFLLTTAEKIYTADQLDEIRYRAASLLMESGQHSEAAELLLAGKRWDALMELIIGQAQKMISLGRSQTLQFWINSIPMEYRTTSPWVCYWLGMCRLPFEPKQARSHFIKAFELFEVAGDQSGLALSWAAIAESTFIAWDEFLFMDPWLEKFEKIFGDKPQFDSIEIEVQVVSSMLIARLFRRPDYEQLRPWVERTEQLVNKIDDSNLRMRLCHKLLLFYAWMGKPAAVKYTMDALQRIVDMKKIQPLLLIHWHIFENMYGFMVGDSGHWRKAIASGVDIANSSGVHILDDVLFGQAVWCSLAENDKSAVAHYLQKLAKVTKPGSHLAEGQYQYLCCLEAMLQGDFNKALTSSQITLREVMDSGVPFAQALSRIAHCHALFETGQRDEAVEQLLIARSTVDAMQSAILEYQLASVESYFAFKQMDNEAGLERLRHAMSIGRASGLMDFPGWRSDVMTLLCLKALQYDIEVAYVQSLISTRNMMPEVAPVDLDNWPWPIKVYTLGRFAVMKDGKKLPAMAKSQKKPLDMLKVLISLGGRAVSEVRLTEALWPDVEGDAAHRSFTTTLHRLRKILGDDVLVMVNGHLTLDDRYCWVDRWRFERLLNRADQRALKKDLTVDELDQLVESLLSLYQGPFLVETSEFWSLSAREHLRSRYIRVLRQLAKRYGHEQQCPKTITLYEYLLEIEDLSEELYYSLMACYAGLGQYSEALLVFNRCKLMLNTVLNIDPSGHIQSLQKAILEQDINHLNHLCDICHSKNLIAQ